jgi:hypothetical protein
VSAVNDYENLRNEATWSGNLFLLFVAGLPDGLFSYQKSKFGYILEVLGMENVGIFYGHLEYFMTIWYVSWPFCIFCGHLVFFPCFGMLYQEKSANLD